MRINLHIERLVLDGLPLERAHGSLVQAAVQQELSRLFTVNRVAPQLSSVGAIPHARGGDMQFPKEATPRQLGTQIAQSVHEGLGEVK